MSLLSICQSACSVTPVAVPSSIVGNQNETAILLLGLANRAGQDLARKPPGGWTSMMREFDFATAALPATDGTVANPYGVGVISGIADYARIIPGLWVAQGTGIPNNAMVTAVNPNGTIVINQPANTTGAGSFSFGQVNYILPGDFQRPIDNTFWDRTRYWNMRGPLSPQQWQMYRSSVIGRASIQRRFRFRSLPLSNAIVIAAGGIGTGGAGGDVAVRTVLSIDPFPFDANAQIVFEYVSNGWCQDTLGNPQTEWMADTDTGVVDEYLLELGLTWRFLRRQGLSYSEELNEYENQVDKAMAHDGGSAILNMTPSDALSFISPYQIQDGNFPGVAT